ncbi:TraQ conjugal transfer family protein [Chryseobacterium indoltheticum]|uniref:TraQ conjugal transfer family protein n=1 Tax=Chryseobacterium indoltheticum TaxID=254 RepID=UPI003F4998C8
MKKLINITRCASGILYTFAVLFLIECSLSSCADHELEITRNFPFEIAVMPVQKGIAIGETVEIRCSIATIVETIPELIIPSDTFSLTEKGV